MENVALNLFDEKTNPESESNKIKNILISLLENEKTTIAKIEEIAAMADRIQRLEASANLMAELDSISATAKEAESILSRSRKRIEDLSSKIEGIVFDEVKEEMKVDAKTDPENLPKDKIQTHNWVFGVKANPPSVVVEDLSKIAQKYRLIPKPIGEWVTWEPDKNAIKQALTKEKVQSISGVFIKREISLVLKPR